MIAFIELIQRVPLLGAIFATLFAFGAMFANGWKEKREGKALGVREEAARNAEANAEVTQDIQERADHEKTTARRIRARIDDGSVSGDADGNPLSDWDYRD